MRPRALWLPFTVPDVVAARDFYARHLELSEVDSWDRDGERGVVLRAADGAFLEFVSPGRPAPVPLAFELATARAVDAAHARWAPAGADAIAPPRRYPRGHYGFEVDGPAGARVMVWAER